MQKLRSAMPVSQKSAQGLRDPPPPPPPEGQFFVTFRKIFSKVCFYVDFSVSFSSAPFWTENDHSKRGVNIGSAHAGACFVRVGRCRLGSILGSILMTLNPWLCTLPMLAHPKIPENPVGMKAFVKLLF